MREKTLPGVIECVCESLALDAGGANEKSSLIKDLGADSLDFMDIMFQLERKFGVKMQKEDFDLISRVGMSREEAISGGKLTPAAKARLKKWLPSLPESKDIEPKELGGYITVETLCVIVEDFLKTKSGAPVG